MESDSSYLLLNLFNKRQPKEKENDSNLKGIYYKLWLNNDIPTTDFIDIMEIEKSIEKFSMIKFS